MITAPLKKDRDGIALDPQDCAAGPELSSGERELFIPWVLAIVERRMSEPERKENAGAKDRRTSPTATVFL